MRSASCTTHQSFSRDVCDQLRGHEHDLSFLFERLLDSLGLIENLFNESGTILTLGRSHAWKTKGDVGRRGRQEENLYRRRLEAMVQLVFQILWNSSWFYVYPLPFATRNGHKSQRQF